MSLRVNRRILLTLGATATAVAMSATPALAHECYNASRSDRGSLQAGTNAKVWGEVIAFTDIADFGFDPLTDAQLQQALAILRAQGVPTVIALGGGSPFEMTCAPEADEWVCHAPNPAGVDVMQAGGSGGDLAERAPEKVLGDGHGIDHLSQTEGEIFGAWGGAYVAVGGVPPQGM